jgi:hypothetical protein
MRGQSVPAHGAGQSELAQCARGVLRTGAQSELDAVRASWAHCTRGVLRTRRDGGRWRG